MSGGGGGNQTTSTTPWSGQQPYLRDLFQQGQQLYGQGPQWAYPGEMVAPFSPQTQMGMDMLTQRAIGGDPTQQAMGDWLQNTMGQPNIDPMQIAQFGAGAAGGIAPGQQMMQQAGMAGPSFGQAANMFGVGQDIGLPGAAQFAGGVTSPYTQALMGSSGYGGLGEASQFFGGPAQGALPASQQFAQSMMQQPGQTIDPAAAAQLGATAGGGYLGSNPYLDQLYETGSERIMEQFQEDVLPSIAGQFGAAGRTGSGAQALMQGRAAGDVAGELAGLYGDIYAPAYEAERGRQVQAAQQLGDLGIGAGQLGLSAGQLGGDLFTAQNQAELGRLGAAADLYTGERGLGQQAMQQAGQLGLGGGQLAADLYGRGGQMDIARLGMAGDQYGQGLDRMLQAGGQLGTLGLGGLESLGGLYGDIGQQQFRAASQVPTFRDLQYGDIDQLMRVGGMAEDQAQRIIDAQMQRYQQNIGAPWQNLQNYANIIYGMPGQYGTATESGGGGSRLAGALGGGLTGFAAGGPIGAGIGALAGLLG